MGKKKSSAVLRRVVTETLESRTLFAQIAGNVFFDVNGDGKSTGDNGVNAFSQTIFLDQNNNGIVDSGEASTNVDQFGNYFFNIATTGNYRVTLMQDQFYIRTAPSNADFINVSITNTSQNVTGINFGITAGASINGTVSNDVNNNGKIDTGEPALQGATAYIDANNNGSFETTTTTASASPNSPVTNAAPVASDINISAGGFVSDVNVTVNVASHNANDPQLFLENPQGVRVLLVSPVDTANDDVRSNFTNTTFDEQSTTSIADANAPFTGSFRTSGYGQGFGLSSFNGMSAGGRWRLIAINTSSGNVMTLNNWSLKIVSGDLGSTTTYGGQYLINTFPGSYNVRATDAGFATTSPSGGKVSLSLNYSDSRSANFDLHETSTHNKTVTFAPSKNLANGTSDSPFDLVSADFNGDGKLDIAAANNGSNDIGIYLGKGDGTFNNPTFLPGAVTVRGIILADVNGDKKPDLVVANHDLNNIGVFISNGNGTFKPMASYGAPTGAWSVAAGDINGDGKIDLVAGGNGANYVQVYIGSGTGTFTLGNKITAGVYPQSVALADTSGDKKLDLIVANNTDNNVKIFTGNGSGNFGLSNTITVGSEPDHIAAGDLNGDGKPDLVISNFGDNNIETLIGKGGNAFDGPNYFISGDTPAYATFADINKDGKMDIITANRSDGGSDPSGNVDVFLGNGDGTLNAPFQYTTHKSPTAVIAADFNGDGSLDLAASNFNSDDVSVLLSTIKTSTSTGTKLTGTTIGTAGSYGNSGNAIAKATDGNFTTYFDGPTANGNWVGIDLGASGGVVKQIGYASRPGYASRMNGGIFEASNSATFASGVVTLYTIGSTANPPSGSLTIQNISNTTAYRYYRYLSPAGSYGDVAEVQFFGTAGGLSGGGAPKLTGSLIGTAGSYGNSGTTIAKAVDGSFSTYFDGPTANGNWVGIDLGTAGGVVTEVAFASRSGFASRMDGGIFQASNSATFASGVVNLYSLSSSANPSSTSLTTVSISNTVAYRYYRYLSPTGSYGDVAEVEFHGTAGGLNNPDETRIIGTTIGTAGSYGNSGNTIAKATDNNFSTYFDGPTANGNWVGVDLGATYTLSSIAFAPRAGYANRMVGGIIQVSTTANFSSGVTNILTITTAPNVGVLTKFNSSATGRYFRYLSPDGSYGDISEFQIFAVLN